jgi:hypothetical protein
MTEILATSALLTVAYALFALIAAWYVLRVFDSLGRVHFKTTIGRISSDPKAAAVYFGCRFIGVCLLVGLVVGLA